MSAPQGVLDALADAETLRQIAETAYGKGRLGFTRKRLTEAWHIYGAEAIGWSSQEPVGRYAGWDTAAMAGYRARLAARAAFRAVPALREEEPSAQQWAERALAREAALGCSPCALEAESILCDACGVAIGDDGCCPSCHVDHSGPPCVGCGRRGYHERTCPEMPDDAAYL